MLDSSLWQGSIGDKVSNLVRNFQEYSAWRSAVTSALEDYRRCLSDCGLADSVVMQRLGHMLARLAEDKVSIAFVAEFSRGKSELINAIFFADYGQRLLPSAAGRTTMCPTELLYDETLPPSIRLLPIETRARSQSTSEFRQEPEAWTVLPLEIDSGQGMFEAFRQVSLTKRVSVEEARRYGLYDDDDAELSVGEDGRVEISCWRHAIVNFPHPLLRQGLVIIDTPGLNAIGTEPELTLNLIPSADAVLFILAADTGVTRSDIEVWRDHIGGGAGRMVVLNKIDSMWDELRSAEEVEAQISNQVSRVAQLLDVVEDQVYPVSAQKGLVARINQDSALLEKSRLPALESALSGELMPDKQRIVREQMRQEIQELGGTMESLLASRVRSVVEQLLELKSLRGKNRSIIEHMMKRVDVEKREFDNSLLKLQATRAVFTRLSTEIFISLSMDGLRQEIERAREAMEHSRFSTGLRAAVREFLVDARASLLNSARKIGEINEMMTAMYRRFSAEHGLALTYPMPFTLYKYIEEIDQIEAIYHKQFGAAALLTTPQLALMTRFFDSIAAKVKQSFAGANRDVESWLKVVLAPVETQIAEHRAQLKQRREAIERILAATDSLEEKIEALETVQAKLEQQQNVLSAARGNLSRAMDTPLEVLKAAA